MKRQSQNMKKLEDKFKSQSLVKLQNIRPFNMKQNIFLMLFKKK